ncbi:SspB family protein [Chelativorans sp. M5D2P16]|uniref:SspB family protein n=1 Tax=Chelativorans sp. M5D2P16 TaxID=3095678 RepID=UPI002ACAE031|nr:SspB family protein [Chelativorans sp. M5D2P16]MDZ5698193.1 SspB family protein [Chelativorans sp. M5D2P16]
MSDDRIRYDILVQDALRGVMRKVLQETADAGLPGNHHFFITFMTGAPGVRISSRLKERYPEQMTIVIQYQYWDLKVSEKGFEVVLSFADTPEKLEVPFSAVRGFYDPSANFEIEFDVARPEATPQPEPVEGAPEPKSQAPAAARKAPGKAKPAAEKSEAEEKADGKGADVVSLDAFRKK